jgi:hypothetical protein
MQASSCMTRIVSPAGRARAIAKRMKTYRRLGRYNAAVSDFEDDKAGVRKR